MSVGAGKGAESKRAQGERNADTVFHERVRMDIFFPHLTERWALKFTDVLHYTGHASRLLWERRIIPKQRLRETDHMMLIWNLDIEVTDAALDLLRGIEVDASARFARVLDEKGDLERLMVQRDYRLEGFGPDGNRVEAARARSQNVFSRRTPDAKGRRVTKLHPVLGLGDLPRRVLTTRRTAELLSAPDGFGPLGGSGAPAAIMDSTDEVWGYEQTDANRHVHAMDYAESMLRFATNALDREGLPASEYAFYAMCATFRRPFHRGDRYRRTGTAWLAPDRERGRFIGRFLHVDGDRKIVEEKLPGLVIALDFHRR